MYKYFSHTGKTRWLDVLPKLVKSYNNTIHRSIKTTPNNAHKPENTEKVYNTLYGDKIRFPKNEKVKFPVRSIVRINKYKSTFEKGYTPNFTSETFIVTSICKKWSPFMYYLKSFDDNEPIEGSFYKEELQLVLKPKSSNVHRVEKILKSTKTKHLVKWMNYSGEPTWVKKSDLYKF